MNKRLLAVAFLLAPALFAQTEPSPADAARQGQSGQPQVKVNYLNVCSPSEEEQKELRSALNRLPRQPKFARDFEVARGRSTMSENANFTQALPAPSEDANSPASDWVRVRREFGALSAFANVQYSFTTEGTGASEVLVFRFREAKDLVQVSLSDSVTTTSSAKTILATDTPVARIRLERFGKSSVVLARCPAGDQSKYNYLFDLASGIMTTYRDSMGVRRIVPGDMARLAPAAKKKAPPASPNPK